MDAPFRIDTQHHFLPKRYVEAIGEAAIARTLVSGRCPDWTPEISIAAMDRHGIATAVLSISAPGFPMADPAELCRLCNEEAAAVVQCYPKRFGQFASLPLPDVDASLKELDYIFEHLRPDGICLLTNYGHRYLGDPTFAPVFDALEQRQAVVYVHPDEAPGASLLGLPPASLEFPFATVRAIANLLFSGTFARTRNVQYIFSHAGGGIQVLGERLARLERRPDLRAQLPDGVMGELRRLHFDVALSATPLSLGALMRLTTPDRILFASDFPHAPEEAMAGTVAGLAQFDMDSDRRMMIERGNAVRLMPRLAN